jgi:hypothetical protein
VGARSALWVREGHAGVIRPIPTSFLKIINVTGRELAVREQCFVSTKESDDRPSRRCVFPFIYKGVLYQVVYCTYCSGIQELAKEETNRRRRH